MKNRNQEIAALRKAVYEYEYRNGETLCISEQATVNSGCTAGCAGDCQGTCSGVCSSSCYNSCKSSYSS